MSRISILPDNLIDKIAAGEVIERPAAVVRELVDNAIDAAATAIDVEVLHGGRKLIKVSDNGTGMDREDASLCFQRHATSKIRTEEELFGISTLGFRGEALPAIASVSKVTLTTFSGNSDTGTRVEIGADRQRVVSEAPPVKGTTVEIRDLFYNTPARKKFLKTITTELSHIIETVLQKALAYPGISFTLIHNKNHLINAPAASGLKERFIQLYGEETAGEFLEVKKESDGIRISGFISSPDFTRASRSHQFIFVNRRPVKNTTVSHAVYSACRDAISGDRHPAYFLFLEIDPAKVDVNVHPAKREVKFERPDEIHRVTGAAVYEALNPGYEIDVSSPPAPQPTAYRGTTPTPYTPRDNTPHTEPATVVSDNVQADFFTSGIMQEVRSFFHIGESFVATVSDRGLVIIDQHAAHERILYERFLKKTSIEAEPLFLPVRIELPVKEFRIIIEHRDFLRGFGLDIEDFGANNIIVRALPRDLRKADLRGLLMDIAAGIIEEETSGIKSDLSEETLLKRTAASLACHRSVRGRGHLTNEELSKMLAELDAAEEPDKCPHGRPTRIILSMDELNRMFRRK
ncbi:MAG: DNA mismatch repair endonuclease MutL [Deferribacteres bacterium]|nr:DNA mismatch repair endonuclease MutL [Deferribacteres bacterium]